MLAIARMRKCAAAPVPEIPDVTDGHCFSQSNWEVSEYLHKAGQKAPREVTHTWLTGVTYSSSPCFEGTRPKGLYP